MKIPFFVFRPKASDVYLFFFLTLYWAFQDSYWFSFVGASSLQSPYAHMVASAACCLVIFCAVLKPVRLFGILASRRLVLAGGVLGSLCFLSSAFVGSGVISAITSFLGGLFMGILTLPLILVCTTRRSFDVVALFSASILAGFALDAMLALLPHNAIAIPAAMPACASLFFVASSLSSRESSSLQNEIDGHTGKRTGRILSFKIGLLLFAFPMGFGFLNYRLDLFPFESSLDNMHMLAIRCASVVVLLMLTLKRIPMSKLLLIGILTLVIGFVVVGDSFLIPKFYTFGIVIAQVGCAWCDVLCWALLASMADSSKTQNVQTVAFGIALGSLGTAIGECIASLLLSASAASEIIGVVVSLIAIILVGASVSFANSGAWAVIKYVDASDHSSSSNAIESGIKSVALGFGLTKREAEVLSYLAKGRSIPYIAEADGVSQNTVRGHVKNIYAKLGIHGKQELIDMIETYSSSSGTPPEMG